MAFLVPGDLCDAEIFILKEVDHSVGAMVPTVTALISGEKMKELLRRPGRIAEANFGGLLLTDLGVLRERIIDHGRREAHERIAHLLYEMLVRSPELPASHRMMLSNFRSHAGRFSRCRRHYAGARQSDVAKAPRGEADFTGKQNTYRPRSGETEGGRRL